MTNQQLIDDYILYREQLANINTAISVLMGKNKIYKYSNVEGTHMAETHSLGELTNLRTSTNELMNSALNQITGPFVKVKNYN